MRQPRRLLLVLLAFSGITASVAPAWGQAVIFVDASATGSGDGSSWADAFTAVQPALDAATNGQQVWVAGGMYVGTITLKLGVALYGGFAGTEDPATFDLADRDFAGHETILDGNQAGSVVTAPAGATDTTRIDGFTITNGNGTPSGNYRYGGGIYCNSSSPTIANNAITDTSASWGGGIYCSSASSPTIANNTITNNSASSGGGLYLSGSSPTIANNTITNNSASSGGGLYLSGSSPTIANTIIAFNSSGIYAPGGSPTLRHNCVYGNVAYNYSGISDPTGADGNISADPRIAGKQYGNVHIQPDSPCVDAGDNAYAYGDSDLDGEPRIQPLGGTVDMGADESDGTVWPAGPYVIVRVSPDGDDAQEGSSWSLAKRTVQAGIDVASALGGEVWVQAGTYAERITLHPYAHVYGGFSGGETEREQRDWRAQVTILDGQQGGSVVSARGGYRVSALDGFTITNGSASGGGLYLYYSSPTIANNTITRNSASSGGGLYLYSSSPTIANNTIAGNDATYSGGGLYLSHYSSPTIANNTITNNSASSGGGLYLSGSSPTIANTIIAFNSSGIYAPGGSPTLRYNCVYGNAAYNYSGISDPTGADGNISADPRIAGRQYGNVHIQPDSPCVDTGDNAHAHGDSDLDGELRIQPLGGTVDMGADESDGTVWPAGPYVIVRVSPDGDDSQDGSSWTLTKRTVQAGIDAASALGGEVWVQAGTYAERITLCPYAHVYGGFSGDETAREERDWSANATTLDSQQQGSVVTARGGYRVSALNGFTITHGSASSGGGIYCSGSSPTIANNTITDNSAYYCGGGIYCSGSSPTIANNTITDNSAYYYGGGLYLSWSSSPTMMNNTIAGNSATQDGGGLYVGWHSSPTIANTIIALNSSGVYRSGTDSNPALLYTSVWGNTAYNYSGLTDPTGSNGNVSTDPLFVESPQPGPDGTWATADDVPGDLHLLAGSPCIDAGSNGAVPAGITTDADGFPRFVDDPRTPDTGAGTPPIVDMGAFEYPSCTTADLDCDGDVDVADLAVLTDCFTGPGRMFAADYDADRDIDLADFTAWSPCLAGPGIPPAAQCLAMSLDGDADVDLADFALFQRHYTGPDAAYLGDFDHDGDIDLADFTAHADCLSGPGAALPEACLALDLDGDADVDLADFAMFQRHFTGPEGFAQLDCWRADLDADKDTDLADFARFQGLVTPEP